jgi:peptidoglycan/LPS O-acetylase OafA/YrhL
VLITGIAICLFNPEPEASLETGLASLFGASNISLLRESTDYFAQSTDLNVFAHTWSLGVEEQFYILFPFLIWFSGFGRQTPNGARNLFIVVGSLSVASLLGFVYAYQVNQPAAYFLMPTRFWEMAAGCLAFVAFQKRASIENRLENVPPLLVLALIIGVMYVPMSLASVSTIAIVVLSSVLIACLKQGTAAFGLFTNPIVARVGLMSYSLYLWHWGVLSVSRWTIGIHWWSVPFQAALMFGLAFASYRWIETPLRKRNWFERRWMTLLCGGGFLALLSIVLLVLKIPLRGKLFAGVPTHQESPPFLQGADCIQKISDHTYCYYSDRKSSRTLWAVGDSHSASLITALNETAGASNMNLKLFTSGGTPFPPLRHYRKSQKQRDLSKVADYESVERVLRSELKSKDVILLAMRLPYHFGGAYYQDRTSDFAFVRADGSLGSREDYLEQWTLSVKDLADFARKRNAIVVIQTPTPEWEQESYKGCSGPGTQWFNRLQTGNCKIDSKFFADDRAGVYRDLFRMIWELSASRSNIHVLDAYSIFCPGQVCSFALDGMNLYRDDDHLSYEAAAELLAPQLSRIIDAN